jgi:hypothetical protein
LLIVNRPIFYNVQANDTCPGNNSQCLLHSSDKYEDIAFKVYNTTMKQVIKAIIGALLGFAAFSVTSHPKSPVHRKIPTRRVRNFSYLPHIKVHRPTSEIHIHHWLSFSALYAGLLAIKPLRKSPLLHGLLLGSILQGLTYEDRFHVVKPIIEVENG